MTRPVFVSYARSDRECAFELVARLESDGIECWIAPRDITPSAEWAAEIVEAIATARLMVLLFSSSSNDSPQVRREVERAVHRRVPVISFRIEDVMPAKSLEYFLSTQHWLDAFHAPREPYYAKLSQHVKRALVSGSTGGSHGSASAPHDSAVAPHDSTALPHDSAVAPHDSTALPHDSTATGVHRDTQATTASFPQCDIERLELKLAGFLGPVAKLLVTRAAARGGSIEDLKQRLAAELESDAERRQFMADAGPSAMRH